MRRRHRSSRHPRRRAHARRGRHSQDDGEGHDARSLSTRQTSRSSLTRRPRVTPGAFLLAQQLHSHKPPVYGQFTTRTHISSPIAARSMPTIRTKPTLNDDVSSTRNVTFEGRSSDDATATRTLTPSTARPSRFCDVQSRPLGEEPRHGDACSPGLRGPPTRGRTSPSRRPPCPTHPARPSPLVPRGSSLASPPNSGRRVESRTEKASPSEAAPLLRKGFARPKPSQGWVAAPPRPRSLPLLPPCTPPPTPSPAKW